MNKLLIALVAGAATVAHLAAAVEYQAVADWLKLPAGRPQLGTMHGDIAVSSSGEVYVSVEDPQAGVQVYAAEDRKSTRLNSSHSQISYAVFCLKKKKKKTNKCKQ